MAEGRGIQGEKMEREAWQPRGGGGGREPGGGKRERGGVLWVGLWFPRARRRTRAWRDFPQPLRKPLAAPLFAAVAPEPEAAGSGSLGLGRGGEGTAFTFLPRG